MIQSHKCISLKRDMLLLTALVRKRTLQLPGRPFKPPVTITFPPTNARSAMIMTSLCFFIVLFSESLSLFVTVCLPLRDLAVSGARFLSSENRHPGGQSAGSFSQNLQSSPEHFTGFHCSFKSFFFSRVSFALFFLSCFLFSASRFSANETVSPCEDVHFLLQDSQS